MLSCYQPQGLQQYPQVHRFSTDYLTQLKLIILSQLLRVILLSQVLDDMNNFNIWNSLLPSVPLGFFPENVTIRSAGPLTIYPAPGAPFGLSFLGTAFSEFSLVGLAFAYEQETQTRLARKAFAAAIPKTQLKDVIGK